MFASRFWMASRMVEDERPVLQGRDEVLEFPSLGLKLLAKSLALLRAVLDPLHLAT